MSTLFGGSGDRASETPIRGEEDLLLTFRSGEKPAESFGIGIEYERLPVSRETGLAVPYAKRSVSPSVERFLETMEERHEWRAEREAGHVIALEKEGTRVTLEPGAQVELSGRVHRDLASAREEVDRFLRVSDEVAASQGFAFIGLGYHPFTDFTQIDWVPKGRYRIMAPYLATRGHLAHGMMKGTAGCQVNLDFATESDAMEKLRVAMAISSIVTAMCANSPLSRGQANGFASLRSHIWLHTDPDRCGVLEFAFREGDRYADYAGYALDVPMLFVVREGRWIDMTGRTFRSFLAGGTAGLTPLLSDWEMHLTTLFPEARLKAYVEVRGSDSGSPDLILAQAALWKGLLYDGRARARAWELVRGASFADRVSFHRAVVRRGLRARLSGVEALDLAQELVRLAEGGLERGEIPHLEPLRRIAFEEKRSPAETLLDLWRGEWGRDARRLAASLAPAPRAA
ncbi:MAG TPA: glutamate-cysteine ligase family protein [Candidatus Polarisedimenticolia bacterium]|jgi:glutamate--cysteine ligase